MKRKTESNGNEDQRAVSPVIGVILMVAITVILAAVIAAFVLDIGDTSANPQAGFQINEVNEPDHELEVTINNIQRLDAIAFNGCTDDETDPNDVTATWDATDEKWLDPGVGDTFELDGCDRTDLQIVGTYDGSEAVMN